MSKSLTDQYIEDTYTGVLHSDLALPEEGQAVIYDGEGNTSSISIGRACNGATICGKLTVDDLEITNNNYLLDKIYPIGSVYFSIVSDNPSIFFGGGWNRIAEGRFVVGVGAGTDSNLKGKSFSGGENYGEYEHTLTISEMPAHTHDLNIVRRDVDATGSQNAANTTSYPSGTTSSTGGDAPHNNIPPSFGLYIWKRVS
jgi:hypothetical protein